MQIDPVIFNWRGQYNKARHTSKQLLNIFPEVTVINSDDQHNEIDWVNLGNSAYFGDQFASALARFEGDILFHVQADATYDNWKEVVDRALETQETYQWGVYAPHVDFTLHTAREVDIRPLDETSPELMLVTCTDCTCWFIHQSVIEEIRRRRISIDTSKFGWGIDYLICAVSYLLGRPVIRDYRNVIDHPKGTGYNTKEARKQMFAFYDQLGGDLRTLITDLQQRRGDYVKEASVIL